MNELQVIESREVLGKDFRIYGTVEEPLFLAKDVAEWIDYSISNVSKMLDKVDDDEKTTRTISTNGNYKTEAWFLTEDGLYEVLMQSRKPIAKAFKKQVKQILKALRLNQIEIATKNTSNDNQQINELINTANNLITTANNLLTYAIDIAQNSQNNFEYESKEIKSKDKLDVIEEEIMNFTEEIMRIQNFCDFINDKDIVPKRIGVQLVNQLLRDNGIYNKYNIPTDENNSYFIKQNTRNLLTKQGMLMLYKLIKDNVNYRYIVRR